MQSITRLEAANKAPAPYDVTNTSNTVRREWAHHNLWAAVMGEEFSTNPDSDWATSVQQPYAGIEPQAALQVALGDGGQGYKALPVFAKVVNDEGLGRLQPGDNRGRERDIVGQMVCLGCGVHIVKPSLQKQRKRIKTARWFAEEAASRAAGKADPRGSDVRDGAGLHDIPRVAVAGWGSSR